LIKAVLSDTDYVISLFAENKNRAIKLFQQFNALENKNKCLEYERTKKTYND